jgi:hypothetical protein
VKATEARYSFESLLELFRMQEQPEQVLCLRGNEGVQQLLVAWPMARLRRVPPSHDQPVSETAAEQWDWLWSHREPDRPDLAMKLGLSLSGLEPVLAMARGNRLIYPDGSVHHYALQYLRAQIAKELGASARAGTR